MAVGCGDKTRSHVVAEERKLRDVGTVGNPQRPAGVAAVLGVPQRRVDAEPDARQIDAFLRAEVRHLAREGRGVVEPQRAGWTCKGYSARSPAP